jgi:hypothetical protein
MNHANKVFGILKTHMKSDQDKLSETVVTSSLTTVKETEIFDEITDDYFGCKYLTSSQVRLSLSCHLH